MKVCCSDCVGAGGWVEWVEDDVVECEICSADCSGIGCCSTHIGYFCGVCLADNENKCLDCGSAFSTDKDEEEEEERYCGERYCGCSFPTFIVRDGIQYCEKCGFIDLYEMIIQKGEMIELWGDEEVKCEDCGKTVCEVGATKQSCRIKAFWVKWEAEEESVSDS